jgi:hypothetical protein
VGPPAAVTTSHHAIIGTPARSAVGAVRKSAKVRILGLSSLARTVSLRVALVLIQAQVTVVRLGGHRSVLGVTIGLGGLMSNCA